MNNKNLKKKKLRKNQTQLPNAIRITKPFKWKVACFISQEIIFYFLRMRIGRRRTVYNIYAAVEQNAFVIIITKDKCNMAAYTLYTIDFLKYMKRRK